MPRAGRRPSPAGFGSNRPRVAGRCGRFGFVDGDAGFLDVGHRPFHVGAGGVAEALRVQAGAQGRLGGAELAEQRLPLAFNGLKFAGFMRVYRRGRFQSFGEPESGSAGRHEFRKPMPPRG